MIGLDLFTDLKKLFLKTNFSIYGLKIVDFVYAVKFLQPPGTAQKTLHPDVKGVRRKSLEYVTS